MTTIEIGELVGVTQGHASNLLKLEERVCDAVLKLWDAAWTDPSGPRVTITSMEQLGKDIPKSAPGRQMAEYQRLVDEAKATKENTRARLRQRRPR